ncbi:MAG: AlpA family phage regulatory protein [Deltaproteobacteria bacterium]|nr:AlpA family phage regulatory protein [Deltaproteobacteria bacterium]
MFHRSSVPKENLQASDLHAANDDVERSKLKFIRLPAVPEQTGLSRSALYRLVDSGDFPKAVKLTERTVAWVESEVDAWNFDKVLERNSRT